MTGDDGTPLAGVRITASTTLAHPVGPTRVFATGSTQAHALSTSGGTFLLENLAPGTYTLCAQGSAAFLDPCNWSKTPPEVTVAANEKASGTKLKLAKGAVLQVRLNDANHLLNSGPSSGAPRYVLVGVSTLAGHYYPLLGATTDSTGRTERLLVPLYENIELKSPAKRWP